MGNLASKPKPNSNLLNGLGFKSDIERDFDQWESLEKLEQLLRATANNYRPNLIPPALVAAYYLGAYPEQLTILYEKWVDEISIKWPIEDPVADSVGKSDLTEVFGDENYELRCFEYFRDCFTEEPDWLQLIKDHRDIIWERLAVNNFRPLILLSSAVESDNDLVVSIALACACTDPSGDAPKPELPKMEYDGAFLSKKLRELSKTALKLASYEAVVSVHALAELVLRRGGNPIMFDTSIALLTSLENFINKSNFEKLPNVTSSDALFSEDWKLITYTRSRMVLEKMAL